MFYISIPLDFRQPPRSAPWSRAALQASAITRTVRIDSTMLNASSLNGIDAKWMIAGLVTVGAAAALGSKDKKTTNELQQHRRSSRTTGGGPAAPCPRPPTDPCKK